MNRSRSLIFLSILLFVNANCPQFCLAIARVYHVPLTSGITQGVGTLGQPVINYYAPIALGTPQIQFNIQFDIGFTELFVPHYSWNAFKNNLHYSKGFQCKSSSSCTRNNNGRLIAVEYQHCLLTGKSYSDTLTFMNAYGNGSSIARPSMHQNFLAISDAADGRFKDLPVDGYFGLSPMSQSPSGTNNLLVSLHSAGYIDNLQFSFWFHPILDGKHGGVLVLGGVDESLYQGQVYWHHLSALNNQWSLNLQHVSLGGQIVSCYNQQCQTVLSSGINEIFGPRDDVRRIYSLLGTTHQSSGLELVDCRRIPSLPVLTFNIDGIPYALLPTNYIRKTVDGIIFKTETCYVAILPSDDNRKWTLGTNFLQAYYSIFDMTYRQVGFATKR